MRAVVYKGPNKVTVDEVEDAKIWASTDALVRVTSTAICGSDLHMYEGRTAAEEGTVFGHEIMGVVEDVGQAVRSVQKGDRVVLPFNIACGFCFNCSRGYFQACLTANDQKAHAAYGYAGMGPFRGGQAEYVTVPFADVNCLKLPGEPGDELEDDFVLLADVFPTGYHGTELAAVQPGDTVAVWGAGPVGLMAALSARIRGAAEIYVVDKLPERLSKAEELGGIPIDFEQGSPSEQIKEHRRSNATVRGAWTKGDEKMDGVLCAIDAVGFQANDEDDPSREMPNQVLEDMVDAVNITGRVGIVGVYISPDPGATSEEGRQGVYAFPMARYFEKGISIGMGQCPVKRYNVHLRHLIEVGRAKPSAIVSHRHSLDEAPEAYEHFDRREHGYTKVVLKP